MDNQIRVLIANDNEEYGRELKNELSDDEMINVVSVVTNRGDVINDVIKYHPDVVVFDVILSDGSGLEMMNEILSLKLAHKSRFIIVSSVSQQNIINKALRMGVEEYYIKPFNIVSLKNKIKKTDYKETVFDRKKINFIEIEDITNDNSVEIMVSNVLHDLGVSSNLAGYDLLKDSIMQTIDEPGTIKLITKKLYPSLAMKYKASEQSVERAIRCCIEIMWQRGDVRVLEQLFGRKESRVRRPTNSQFIAIVAEKIRLERKMELNKAF